MNALTNTCITTPLHTQTHTHTYPETRQAHRSTMSSTLCPFFFHQLSVSSLMNYSSQVEEVAHPNPTFPLILALNIFYYWLKSQTVQNVLYLKTGILILITSALFPQAASVSRHSSEENYFQIKFTLLSCFYSKMVPSLWQNSYLLLCRSAYARLSDMSKLWDLTLIIWH